MPVFHIEIPHPQTPVANNATKSASEESSLPDALPTGNSLLPFSHISPFISYLGPFLCDNCSDMHPTPFCPKDCNSLALTCSYQPRSTAIWPCNACFCHRQRAAKFSPSDPPSCPFSPVCIDILTGGPWGQSSDSPDSPSSKLYHYLPFLSN